MNLAIRDIRHNLGRFLLTCVGVSLLLSVVMSMIGIYRGLVVEALTIARAPAAHLWVVEANSRGPFAETSRIPGDVRELVLRIAGIVESGALTYQSAEVEHRGRKLRLYLVGYEPGRLGGPPNLVEGRPISQSRFELVADSAAGFILGEQVKLGRSMFAVVGLTRGQVSSGGDPVVYLTLRDAQKLQFELAPPAARRELARGGAGVNSDIVNAVVARVSDNIPLSNLTESVKRWKHLSALTHDEQETILTRSVIERARRQIGLFTSILLLVSTVIIALIIYTLTIDKMREIATLKLIGAPDRTIIGLIVQQALAMGAVGFLFATAFVHAIRPYFPRRVELLTGDAGALAAVLLLICLVASGLAVRFALKVDPATALGG